MMNIAVALSLGTLVLPIAGAERWDVGLTQSGARIEAIAIPGPTASAPTVLLMGGLAGNDESVRIVTQEARKAKSRRFRLLAIPLANPDQSKLHFPPAGVAYKDNPESHALWRWIAIQAPDLVLIVGEDFGMAEALSQNVVAGVGRIPARRVPATAGILNSLPKKIPQSDAHREIVRRRSRSPRQIAEELAQFYGHDFDQPVYINAIALIGQLRLGHLADVERILAPYVNGEKNSLARPSSLSLAGQLVFGELAQRTGDARYVEIVRKTADLGFTATGEMKESMPFHDEYSDSVFMACPIVAKAGKLTGERKYFDMAARHLAFMQKLVLRPDGLYRHQPLTDAAWGRGNGFPALGLALTLSDFPRDHPEFGRMLLAFQQHMSKLAQFQDENGMWREVVDHAGSYSEFTATAMIATAYLRGIRNGWLDGAAYQPRVDEAWQAISARVGSAGQLVDVCESTAKQQSLRDYLERAAILGRDPRGGAMALLFATEMADLQ